MASKLQQRQQRLFALKGTLTAASVNCKNAINTPEFNQVMKESLIFAAGHIDFVLKNFNRLVGWKTK